jgi:hypothetical protein
LREGLETGSPEWWQAQYKVAKTLMLLGRTETCREVIVREKQMRPSLGGPKLKPKFERMLKACR